jgi:hypothetical protein
VCNTPRGFLDTYVAAHSMIHLKPLNGDNSALKKPVQNAFLLPCQPHFFLRTSLTLIYNLWPKVWGEASPGDVAGAIGDFSGPYYKGLD